MADYIDRQAVIDIVRGYGERLNDHIGTLDDSEVYAYARGLILSIESNICGVPSADVQPVRNWIPVSKDLPKTPIRVQVQLDNNWIITAYYDEGEWYDVPGDGEPIDGVLAWMPLPEPYKDGEQNDIR